MKIEEKCKDVSSAINSFIDICKKFDQLQGKKKELFWGESDEKTATLLHRLSQFLEGKTTLECAAALKTSLIISDCITLLTSYQKLVEMCKESQQPLPIPKWLAPLALLLDLYDKVALSTKQKQQMHKICTRQWQWYDISTSKWTNYLPPQNKQINDAYMAGESEIQIMLSRHRYTMNFKEMSQINKEKFHCPILMALRSIEAMYSAPSGAFDEKAEDQAAAEEQAAASGGKKLI